MEVHVFRTNVEETQQADLIIRDLNRFLDLGHVNFDLDDCDNILRIEANELTNGQIEFLLKNLGYSCEAL